MPDAAENPGEISSPLPCIDADGRVAAWVCCQKCRYNLFGLDAQGNCPECGAAIVHSTAASVLRSMPAAWLTAVRNCAGLIRLAIGAAFLAAVAGLSAIAAQTSMEIAVLLLAISILAIIAAGFSVSRTDDRGCPPRIRETRGAFTDSLVVAPALIPILLAGMLTPSFSPHGMPANAAMIAARLVAVAIGCLLFWLCILVAIRPITTLVRFLRELFDHAQPVNSERAGRVLLLAGAAHWLSAIAIALGLARMEIRHPSISSGLSELAAITGIFGGMAFVGSLAALYRLLGAVSAGLAIPIREARRVNAAKNRLVRLETRSEAQVASDDLPSVPLDQDGRLTQPITCRSCGYILFGLLKAGNCPECGAAVAASLRPSLVRSLSASGLISLRRATGMQGVGIVFGLSGILVVPQLGLVGVLPMIAASISPSRRCSHWTISRAEFPRYRPDSRTRA